MNLVSVTTDDWEVLYVNGEKLIEGHSIYWERLLERLHDIGLIDYNWHSYELSEDAVENILECNFPRKVSEFPKELDIR